MEKKENGPSEKASNGGIDGPTNPMVTPLLNDLYQFTMAYAYWKAGKQQERAVSVFLVLFFGFRFNLLTVFVYFAFLFGCRHSALKLKLIVAVLCFFAELSGFTVFD